MVRESRNTDRKVRMGIVSQRASGVSRINATIDRGDPGNPCADRFTDVLGLQGLLQDGTKLVALQSSASSVAGTVARNLNAVVMGHRLAMGPALRLSERRLAHAAPVTQRVFKPLLNAGQATARFGAAFGRYGPVISLPFAVYDVYKAILETEPQKKRAASFNASMTVLGTGFGTVGVMVASVPIAVFCLALSAGIGAFQLSDAYLNKGRVNQQLGDRFFYWMRG